jgi:hypothetical protein
MGLKAALFVLAAGSAAWYVYSTAPTPSSSDDDRQAGVDRADRKRR